MVPLAQRRSPKQQQKEMFRKSASGFRLGVAMQQEPRLRIAPDSPVNNTRYGPPAAQAGKENSAGRSQEGGLALEGKRLAIGREEDTHRSRSSADSRTALISSRRPSRKSAWEEPPPPAEGAAMWEAAKQQAVARHADPFAVEEQDNVLVQSTTALAVGAEDWAGEEAVRTSRTKVVPQVTSSPQRGKPKQSTARSNASPNDTPSPPQRGACEERKPTIAEMLQRFRSSPATARSERAETGTFWWQAGGGPGSPGSLTSGGTDSAGSSPARDPSVESSPGWSGKSESPPPSLWAVRSPGSLSSGSSAGREQFGYEDGGRGEEEEEDDDDEELDVLEMYRREQQRAQTVINTLSPLQGSDTDSPPRSSRSRSLSSSVEALDAAAEHAIARAELLHDQETTCSAAEDDLLARWRRQHEEVEALKAELFGATSLDSLELGAHENTGKAAQQPGESELGNEQQRIPRPALTDDAESGVAGHGCAPAGGEDQTGLSGGAQAPIEDPEPERDSTLEQQPQPQPQPQQQHSPSVPALHEACDSSLQLGQPSVDGSARIAAQDREALFPAVLNKAKHADGDTIRYEGSISNADAERQLQLKPPAVEAAATASSPSIHAHTRSNLGGGGTLDTHKSGGPTGGSSRADGSPTKSSPPRSPHSERPRSSATGGPPRAVVAGRHHQLDGVVDRLLVDTVHRGLYGAFAAGWEAAVYEGGHEVALNRTDKAEAESGAGTANCGAAVTVPCTEVEAVGAATVDALMAASQTNQVPEPTLETQPERPEQRAQPMAEELLIEPAIKIAAPLAAPSPITVGCDAEPQLPTEEAALGASVQPQSPEMKAAQSRLASIEARLADQRQRLKLFDIAATETGAEPEPEPEAQPEAQPEPEPDLELEAEAQPEAEPERTELQAQPVQEEEEVLGSHPPAASLAAPSPITITVGCDADPQLPTERTVLDASFQPLTPEISKASQSSGRHQFPATDSGAVAHGAGTELMAVGVAKAEPCPVIEPEPEPEPEPTTSSAVSTHWSASAVTPSTATPSAAALAEGPVQTTNDPMVENDAVVQMLRAQIKAYQEQLVLLQQL
eukprot:COSAG03_NODE_728_length_6065_cov_12.641636_3_plen_1074_part_00